MSRKKKCLIIYIGNGYSEESLSYDGSYSYSIDMRDNRENHQKYVYSPLIEMGYSVDTLLMTNKHEKYNEFLDEYNSLRIYYDDITAQDEENLYNYYFNLKVIEGYGPGTFKSGGRFLKLRQKIPTYDLYVFVRADTQFKISMSEMDINFKKINYLWPETDIQFFTDRETAIKIYGDEKLFWNSYYRVNGNVFNVVPKKFFNIFTNYCWAEHCAVHLMIRDLSPLITIKDIHLICGEDKCYVADPKIVENPIYTFNKKIFSN
jgi:hypothetical protein